MEQNWRELKVLVLVKTYPRPSQHHQEVVCTAGMTEEGKWIRLYPINYRYRPYTQWFRKYEWIKVVAVKHSNDPRPESYRPDPDKPIETVSHLPADRDWSARKKSVLANPPATMCGLQKSGPLSQSLAVVKPKIVHDLVIEKDSPSWEPKYQKLFEQLTLFGPGQKPLEKIPWKFKYRYRCEASNCRGHQQTILDWEIYQLFRKIRDKKGEEKALKDVRAKFLDEMCGPNRDTYFFVGNVYQKKAWIVVGVFWPPKNPE